MTRELKVMSRVEMVSPMLNADKIKAAQMTPTPSDKITRRVMITKRIVRIAGIKA